MRTMQLIVAVLLFVPGVAWGEEPVHFPDVSLKMAVEEELQLTDPTPTDMLGLIELTYHHTPGPDSPIADLTGLEYAVNLRTLSLRNHEIRDISVLSGLSQLEVINLHRNLVADISPLANLTSLTRLDLRINPLDGAAYSTYLPQIQANNPEIALLYDAIFMGTLVLSSGPGGSVVSPGEGEFTFAFNEWVVVEARAAPGFLFVGWSGNYRTTQNPAHVTMDQNYEMRANFARVPLTLHVDDNAPGDPSPGDLASSDPQEDGTAQHPFDSIQEAIAAAEKGTGTLVHPGTYRENIDLLGKNILLTGRDPCNPVRMAWPLLEGAGTGPVVSFRSGEGPACTIMGFVITRRQSGPAGAIYCAESAPTIANCLIVGNRTSDPHGAALYCTASQAVLTNCTIADNYSDGQQAALVLWDSNVTIINSILWKNQPGGILALGTSQPSIRYCDIQGWWPDVGNIEADPLFARHGRWVDPYDPNVILGPENQRAVWRAGDYHLKSQYGRWQPEAGTWVQDDVTSPCLDRGSMTSSVADEPAPNGGGVNLGAYGGTREASKSLISASP